MSRNREDGGKISANLSNKYEGRFPDEKFVTQLATEHPSTFKKIYNWFQHLFKMTTSGSKESYYLDNYVLEEVNKYGYSDKEIQKHIEDMYGKENLTRYNPTNHSFEGYEESGRGSRQTSTKNRQDERNGIEKGNRNDNREVNKYAGRFADGTDAQLQQVKKNLEVNINRLTEAVKSQEKLNKISKGSVDEQLAINRNILKEIKLQEERYRRYFFFFE